MAGRKSYAVAQAILFIKNAIESEGVAPGEALPALKILAHNAGVSLQTMWKAAHALQQSGLLKSVKGHCYIVASQLPDRQSDSANAKLEDGELARSTQLWQRVQERIAKDILGGNFTPAAQLLSVKELQSRYNVSFRTLKKALHECVKSGIIEAHQRGYRARSLVPKRSHARIIVIGSQLQDGFIKLGMHDELLLRICEEECARARVNVELAGIQSRDGSAVCELIAGGRPLSFTSDDSVLGYLYIANVIADLHGSVINSLSHTGKPVSIYDEVGCRQNLRSLPSMRNACIFRNTTSLIPGRQVGRYLLELGHKKIAYISPFHQYAWSRMRLKALKDIFNEAGLDDGVVPFVSELDFITDAKAHSHVSRLQKYYVNWQKDIPQPFVPDFNDCMAYMVKWGTTWGEQRMQMEPVFDSIRTDTGITAWVFPSDFLGTVAQDYLRQRNINVPGDISIVAFDNSSRALKHRLTSYSFNTPALARAMLEFVVNRENARWRKKNRVIEIEGTIVERESSGRAKAQ
jgi:DNA-binding LacI/PurR family transcriptional regulator/DNA-binding transcriptional regulator YhcF (GntR family)